MRVRIGYQVGKTSPFGPLDGSSRDEEFMKHFSSKYDGKLPVWVATEIMTFGCMTHLLSLLSARDAGQIASNLGIRNRNILHKCLKALNVLRNHCAHNAQLWNRSTIYPPQKTARQHRAAETAAFASGRSESPIFLGRTHRPLRDGAAPVFRLASSIRVARVHLPSVSRYGP